MYVGQMRCTWLPQPGASLWWVPLQGVDNQATAPTSPNPSQPASDIHGLRHSRRVAAGVPPCRPSSYIIRGQEDASKLIECWREMPGNSSRRHDKWLRL